MLTNPPGNRLRNWRFDQQDSPLTDQQWAALWAWVAMQKINQDAGDPFNVLIVVVRALLSAGMDPTDSLPVLEGEAGAAANIFLDRLSEPCADQ